MAVTTSLDVAEEANTIALIEGVLVGLLWLLGTVAVLLIAVCLPPVHLRARIDSLHLGEETPVDWDEVAFSARISGLLGALIVILERRDRKVQAQLQLFGITKRIGHRRDEQDDAKAARRVVKSNASAKAKPRTKSASRPRRTPPITLSDLRRLLPEMPWILRRARQLLKFHVKGTLVYGFSDPFTTAMANALIGSLPLSPELNLKPDYVEKTLDGWIELSMRTYLLKGVYLLVRVGLRPAVRSIWWPQLQRAMWRVPKRSKEAARA